MSGNARTLREGCLLNAWDTLNWWRRPSISEITKSRKAENTKKARTDAEFLVEIKSGSLGLNKPRPMVLLQRIAVDCSFEEGLPGRFAAIGDETLSGLAEALSPQPAC
jgi:hypothetical protein